MKSSEIKELMSQKLEKVNRYRDLSYDLAPIPRTLEKGCLSHMKLYRSYDLFFDSTEKDMFIVTHVSSIKANILLWYIEYNLSYNLRKCEIGNKGSRNISVVASTFHHLQANIMNTLQSTTVNQLSFSMIVHWLMILLSSFIY